MYLFNLFYKKNFSFNQKKKKKIKVCTVRHENANSNLENNYFEKKKSQILGLYLAHTVITASTFSNSFFI